jgi:hypothetical protein
MNDRIPLFVFPIGGRGDFLISILYGHVLFDNWDCPTINNTGLQQTVHKIHQPGPSDYHSGITHIGPDNLDQFYSFKISIDTVEDLLEVAYFALVKRFPEKDNAPTLQSTISLTQWSRLHSVVSLIEHNENYFDNCEFDCRIPFSKLTDVDYINDLYAKINHKVLSNSELERIQKNIDLNNKILENNPFIVQDIVGMLDNNFKLRTEYYTSIEIHDINLQLKKKEIEALFSITQLLINNCSPVKLNPKDIKELTSVIQQIKGQYSG